jgi:hypothetical protein
MYSARLDFWMFVVLSVTTVAQLSNAIGHQDEPAGQPEVMWNISINLCFHGFDSHQLSADGKSLFVATRNGNTPESPIVINAIDAGVGSVLWSVSTTGSYDHSLHIGHYDRLYSVSDMQTFTALSQEYGSQYWSAFDASVSSTTRLVETNENVTYVGVGKHLQVYNATTGVWLTSSTSYYHHIYNTPVADGNDIIFAVGCQIIRWRYTETEPRWQYQGMCPGTDNGLTIALGRDRVYVLGQWTALNGTNYANVTAIDAQDGYPIWGRSWPMGNNNNGLGAEGPDGNFYFHNGADDTRTCLDGRTGRTLWSWPEELALYTETTPLFNRADEYVQVGQNRTNLDCVLVAYSMTTGQRHWSKSVSTSCWGNHPIHASVTSDGVAFVGIDGLSLLAVRLPVPPTPAPTPGPPSPQPTAPGIVELLYTGTLTCQNGFPATIRNRPGCSADPNRRSSVLRTCNNTTLHIAFYNSSATCTGTPFLQESYVLNTCYPSIATSQSFTIVQCD